MFDENDRLRESPALVRLLRHYAELNLSKEDREEWRDRVMELDGVSPRELVRLHGELIAYDWLEQRTGRTPVLKADIAAASYRITRDGIRTYKALEEILAETPT